MPVMDDALLCAQLAWADAAPASMGILVAGVLVASAIVNSAKAIQWLEGRHAWLWTLWTDALAVLGWALLPFVSSLPHLLLTY